MELPQWYLKGGGLELPQWCLDGVLDYLTVVWLGCCNYLIGVWMGYWNYTWVVSRRGTVIELHTSVLFEWGNWDYLSGVWMGYWNYLMVSGWGTGTT
jgi:hypothetical protein